MKRQIIDNTTTVSFFLMKKEKPIIIIIQSVCNVRWLRTNNITTLASWPQGDPSFFMRILVIFTTQEVNWIPSRKKKSSGFLKSKHNNYFIFTGPPGPQIIQLIPWHLFFYTPSILKCKTFFNTIKHLTFRHRGSKGVSLMQLRYQFSLTKSGQLHNM